MKRFSLPALLSLLGICTLLLFPCCVSGDVIHDAAGNGDVAAVQRLLTEDARRVDARTPAGATPLLWAAIRGQAAVARLLVEKGADVTLAQGDGWTPLHAAVCDGNDAAHVEIARLLLIHGAKIEGKNALGWTPLHAAALKGNLATMQVLLENKATLDARDNNGGTPLHLAAEQGQTRAVQWLLAQGAEREAKDNKGNSPLQRAMSAGKLEAAETLLDAVRVTLHFDHAPLAEALSQVFTPAHAPYALNAALKGDVTLDLKDTPTAHALRAVLRAATDRPLTYALQNGVFQVRSAVLLQNGGLEDNDGKQAVGFDLSAFGVGLSSRVAHTGRHSIQTACDGLHVSTFHTHNIPLPPPYDRPRRVLARAWIKAKDLRIAHQGGWSAGHLMLWAHDARGDKIKTMNPNGWDNVGLGEFAGYFSGTFDWREVQGNFVAPPGTASLSLEGGIGWATGTAWFDDLAVEEASLAWEPQEDSEARLVVDTAKRRARTVEGIGWNWSYIWDQPFEMNTSSELLDQLLHYAEWDQQSLVRFGFLAQRCLKDDWRKAPPVYDATKPGAVFYERVLAGLDHLGVRILACNWQYGDGTGPYPKPPYPAARFAGGVAEVVGHWLTRNRFSTIRWVSLWNEPDWWYKEGDYRGDFPVYWNALDARLRALGLRERLGIVGADTTQGGSIAENAFPVMSAQMGTSLDAFSAHDYFAAVEAPGRETSGGVMQPYLRGYAGTVQALGSKSLFVGEFGCGLGSDDASYRGTLGGAELIVGGLNAGVRGFARWAYNHADTESASGFNPFVMVNSKLQPKRSVYYGYVVLTKAIRPGMQVAATTLQGGKDAEGEQRVHATALVKASGELALILVNDGLQSKTVHLSGLNGNRLYHYAYDATLPDGLQRGNDLASEDATVVLKPMSINALTSWQWDRLKP